MKTPVSILLLLACLFILGNRLEAQNDEFKALQAHFERVAEERFTDLFKGINTVGDWEKRKTVTRANLARMLWHEHEWPSAPPPVRIVKRQQFDNYVMENIILESAPGVFATANLYIPRTGSAPYPVVLYQNGHVNKRILCHHAAWFATRGIAALNIDNIEMGEMEFTHHGVYAHAWFHWYSRGFSPMAVELLNAIRAVDYLASRPELDSSRIGATGVSGGGMATFFLAALDERIKASAPVSGAFSTHGWVRKHLASAHCDCQYPVNSYGQMYEEIGALTAPRTQLLCNADADRGFPMDAFNEMVDKMREVYSLYGASNELRTAVVPGGHGDNEVIRLPVYQFFLKEFLGLDTTITEQGPVETPSAEQQICWIDGLPLDERLTRIDQELVPAFSLAPGPIPADRRDSRRAELVSSLRKEVFRYFPTVGAPLDPVEDRAVNRQGRRIADVSFNSFSDLRVRAKLSLPEGYSGGERLPAVLLVDHRRGIPVWGNEQPLELGQWGDRVVLVVETLDKGSRALEQNLRSFSDDDPIHHLRREAMICGTTLDAMGVYEILRALEFLRARKEVDPERVTVLGKGEAGINGLYAALLDGATRRVVLESPTFSHRHGPHYPGILRYTDIPEVISLFADRVRLFGEIPLGLREYLERGRPADGLFRESLGDCLP